MNTKGVELAQGGFVANGAAFSSVEEFISLHKFPLELGAHFTRRG